MYTYAARLVRVVDGDTVVLDLDFGFYQWRLNRSYRLARIDAPEMSTMEGHEARSWLVVRLSGVRAYLVTTSKADSFDRWIVELYADGINISDALVTASMAAYRTYS